MPDEPEIIEAKVTRVAPVEGEAPGAEGAGADGAGAGEQLARVLPRPEPRVAIGVRVATMDDMPAIDALQKRFSKALGFFPRAQMEGYIREGWVLVACEGEDRGSRIEDSDGNPSSILHSPSSSARLVGYCASRDRYMKRDELGIIYQLCVAPGAQRKLVGAELLREVFARSAYGCRLYCCWCAKDLDANYFWQSMGFVPIAFRAGSSKKGRVHIFWQKRIVEGDTQTRWWYPSKTDQGAIREDRLAFPIPPGVSWKDVEAVANSESSNLQITNHKEAPRANKEKAAKPVEPSRRAKIASGGLFFTAPESERPAKVPRARLEQGRKARLEQGRKARPERSRSAKVKHDPQYIAAARELRDRWMEQVAKNPELIAAERSSTAKYDVTRQIASNQSRADLPAFGAPRHLPLAA